MPQRSPRPRLADPQTRLEPAVIQLRELPPDRLDRLVATWLSRLGFQSIALCEQDGSCRTYRALLERGAASVSLRVRIIQRKTKLQPHQVDAFAGHLLHSRSAHGILIATGGTTQAAAIQAEAFRMPQIFLYTGVEWLSELRGRRLGVVRKSICQFVLDLTGLSPVLTAPGRQERRGRV